MIVGVGVFGVGGVLPVRHRGQQCDLHRVVGAVGDLDHSHDGTKSDREPEHQAPQAGGGNTVAAPGLADNSVWDALAQCESGGNWAINTGNGLFGGLQLDRGAWLSNGGAAYAPLPSDATRQQQILIAEKVRADRGFSPWSSCARGLGLL